VALAASWLTGGPYRGSAGMYIGGRELVSVRAPAGQDCRSALCSERHRLVYRIPDREAVREARGEAVAAAVGVGDRPGELRGPERAARPDPTAQSRSIRSV
jgi:hypothetical protein